MYGKDNVFSCCYVDLSNCLFYNKSKIVRLVTVFHGRGCFGVPKRRDFLSEHARHVLFIWLSVVPWVLLLALILRGWGLLDGGWRYLPYLILSAVPYIGYILVYKESMRTSILSKIMWIVGMIGQTIFFCLAFGLMEPIDEPPLVSFFMVIIYMGAFYVFSVGSKIISLILFISLVIHKKDRPYDTGAES